MREVALENFGNPSSIHRWGEKARALLEESRARCAEILGCAAERVCFTSGGSESNNIIFGSLVRKARPGRIVTTAVEHSSVYEPSRLLEKFGWTVTRIGRGKGGRIGPDEVAAALTKDTALVSIMLVNNETGMLQPLREIARAVRGYCSGGHKIHIHTDAVQAAGKIPLSVQELGVDSLSLSGHKFRGPRGAGILVTGGGLEPLYVGGGQEKGLRPGTENLPGIAAMTRALGTAHFRLAENFGHAQKLMGILLDAVSSCSRCKVIPQDRLSMPQNYSPYIVSLAFPPVPGEVMVRVMNDRGYAISTGSACSARKKKDTRVIEGSGALPELAFSSLRVSIGPATTEDEIRAFCRDLMEEAAILLKVAS
jgi:cysteine desulfurase